MSVAFVFTNPRHHLEMMSPVATELERRGVRVKMISLAELRGFETPRSDRRLHRAIPLAMRSRTGRSRPDPGASTWSREVARRLAWQPLRLRLRMMLAGARVVVIPNDAVYPYTELVADLHRRGMRTVLMQEGIRFPLPTEYSGPIYGANKNAAVCAWGEGSRDYFIASNVSRDAIEVTGAPRLDDLDVATWRDAGAALLDRHELRSPPIAFLSNPIEIQGYGDVRVKLDLFARLLDGLTPIVRSREIPITVKTHPHEDPADFVRIAASSQIGDLVKVLVDDPIFAAIASARAAIVLTSTVGLETLMFGVPLGVLEIPGHDFAFEYVQRNAATPLYVSKLATGIEELLDGGESRRVAAAAFVERHLHDRGRARFNVATVIERVLAG